MMTGVEVGLAIAGLVGPAAHYTAKAIEQLQNLYELYQDATNTRYLAQLQDELLRWDALLDSLRATQFWSEEDKFKKLKTKVERIFEKYRTTLEETNSILDKFQTLGEDKDAIWKSLQTLSQNRESFQHQRPKLERWTNTVNQYVILVLLTWTYTNKYKRIINADTNQQARLNAKTLGEIKSKLEQLEGKLGGELATGKSQDRYQALGRSQERQQHAKWLQRLAEILDNYPEGSDPTTTAAEKPKQLTEETFKDGATRSQYLDQSTMTYIRYKDRSTMTKNCHTERSTMVTEFCIDPWGPLRGPKPWLSSPTNLTTFSNPEEIPDKSPVCKAVKKLIENVQWSGSIFDGTFGSETYTEVEVFKTSKKDSIETNFNYHDKNHTSFAIILPRHLLQYIIQTFQAPENAIERLASESVIRRMSFVTKPANFRSPFSFNAGKSSKIKFMIHWDIPKEREITRDEIWHRISYFRELNNQKDIPLRDEMVVCMTVPFKKYSEWAHEPQSNDPLSILWALGILVVVQAMVTNPDGSTNKESWCPIWEVKNEKKCRIHAYFQEVSTRYTRVNIRR
jgi:hypothetical protein